MSIRLPRQALMAAAFASALAAAPAVRATEYTRMEPLWIDTVAPDGSVGHTIPALLNIPPGWTLGDAAVVVLSDGPWPGSARERMVAALLGQAAAVLELDVDTARGFSPENALMAPPPTADELLPDLLAAVEALRREAGAGLVVALGHGAGGDTAALAASQDPSGRAGGGIAAAASLGPGPPRFALGGAAPGRGWPVRAGLLCELLATAAPPTEPGAEADCRRALVGPSETYAGRAGAR